MYNCSDHSDQLKACFGLDVSKDVQDTHPSKFCNPCYKASKRWLKASEAGTSYSSSTTTFNWTQHTDNCLVRLEYCLSRLHKLSFQVCEHFSRWRPE